VGSPTARAGPIRWCFGAGGASKAGAQVELVQMADHVVEACKDCLPWECMKTLKCRYEDPAFEYLSDRLLHCGAVCWGPSTGGTPRDGQVPHPQDVPRLCPLRPACRPAGLGIGIAGGTGNGLVSGLRPVYHFFQMLQMRALEPLPVTRFHWDTHAGERRIGRGARGMAAARHPFAGVEERLLWYDALPYLDLDRGRAASARRLTTTALPPTADPAIPRGLAEADALARGASPCGRFRRSAGRTSSVKAFEEKQG